MKVLVIGGAGYIGSHAVYELIRDNNEVIVMDNLSTGKENMIHKSAKFYLGDITKKEDLDKVFDSEKNIDVVMHFAAKLIVPESVKMPLEYYYNNVEGVRLMLDAMIRYGVKNVVFSSTAAVYGEPIKPICEEDDITLPINPYGASKLATENMIKWVCNAYNMNYCIFRYFNVAGADKSLDIGLDKDNLTHLIPIVTQTILGIRNKMKVFGDDYDTPDGTCIRDYIHVTDLALAHILGAKYILNNNKSILVNLGSNNGYSVKEVIDAASIYGKVNYEIVERREGDPAKLIASNSKAKDLLGWIPKYTLDDMIKTDLEFRRKINNK
ncbi:MAG: UDP-glucose 4-epimerase GalE [Tenericutes bacterium]|nr:UDP-glucose 4-epimerase GalE [Mycoplasmatota bacterium]